MQPPGPAKARLLQWLKALIASYRRALGRLRNFANGPADLLNLPRFRGEIAEGDNPAELFLTREHRQTANLFLLHDPLRLLDRIIFKAVGDLGAHVVSYKCCLWITPFGCRANGDIAICDHADEPIPIADWQRSNVELPHFLRCFAH